MINRRELLLELNIAGVELLRECKACKLVKPLDLRYFYQRESKNLAYQHKCRDCTNIRKLESQNRRKRNPEGRRGRPVKCGKLCPECGALPHRVQGPKCWGCQLEYAPEPTLDIRDYLYRAPDREIV